MVHLHIFLLLSIKQGTNNCKEHYIEYKQLIPRAAKFLAVLGTVFPNNPTTTLPAGLPDTARSRYTFCVTSGSSAAAACLRRMTREITSGFAGVSQLSVTDLSILRVNSRSFQRFREPHLPHQTTYCPCSAAGVHEADCCEDPNTAEPVCHPIYLLLAVRKPAALAQKIKGDHTSHLSRQIKAAAATPTCTARREIWASNWSLWPSVEFSAHGSPLSGVDTPAEPLTAT